ncbi:MAG TPA: secretin N-terminal domain-containing protein, partial [Blastocatellia bacterium]|nr:secretin N-terminal domain-containing protein [Blastocatellia bacterium]
YAENQQWDKAAEKFAIAVAEKPSNVEYQLHLQRALVKAGLMLVERGDELAEKKDYNAAYNAYRQAYAYDRTNEVALIKMRKMLEAQGLSTESLPKGGYPSGRRTTSGSTLKTSANGAIAIPGEIRRTQLPGLPSRRFPKTDVKFPNISLLTAIEQLAQDIGLNVMWDQQTANQMRAAKVTIELRDVTKPKALEMILKTNNMLYAQMDTRTIVVALDNPQTRNRYEPYAVRTFYIKNAALDEVRQAINATVKTKEIVPVKQLNALLVRDSPMNLELIDKLIASLDKAKAEVLIDINIYEVSRTDLLQIGNQINVPSQSGQRGALDLGFIGGLGQDGTVKGLGRSHTFIGSGALGFALGLPTSAISFFQDRGKAKLLAATQVHVLDNEKSAVRIGQRVPIETAAFPAFTTVLDTNQGGNNNNNNNQNNRNNSPFFGNLGNNFFPQIQYENVGLNIDMQPQVFEDEIQMKMKIETSSVDSSTGVRTPTFNQRTMDSVARVKDGQTTLIAGVSQTNESKNIKGIPIIGLIPILGRFFATPENRNTQSDVVITVTPHILRRADITEEDHLATYSGTGNDPSLQLTLEEILYVADIKDAQQTQTAGNTSPPPAVAAGPPPGQGTVNTAAPIRPQPRQEAPGVVVIQPAAETSPPSAPPQPRVERREVPAPGIDPDEEEDDDDDDDEDTAAQGQGQEQLGPVTVSVRSAQAIAARGQDLYVAVIINGNAEMSASTISISYDPNILDVKNVRDGGML